MWARCSPEHHGVVGVEPAHQGQAQLGDPRPHTGQGHLGQHLGVPFTGDKRLEHPPVHGLPITR